jgi:hypothetical protein
MYVHMYEDDGDFCTLLRDGQQGYPFLVPCGVGVTKNPYGTRAFGSRE